MAYITYNRNDELFKQSNTPLKLISSNVFAVCSKKSYAYVMYD